MKKFTKTLAALCGLAISVSATAQDHDWQFVATGDGTTHAIDANGSLWAWGWNDEGQLGYELPMKPDGSARYDRTAVPQQVGTDTDWVSAVSGTSRVYALKSDGTLWAAGMNSKGVQGTGSSSKNTVLTQVPGENWAKVATSRFFAYTTLAIKTDGSLWSWGEGEWGVLGTGKTANSSTPVQVGTDTDWADITVGVMHALAVKTDGTLWGWGFNERKQLLDASSFNKTPIQLGTDTDWASVVAVDYCSYGIKKDGSLWKWGVEFIGDDNNPSVEISTPVMVEGFDAPVISISGSEKYRIAATGNNGVISKVYTWGYNIEGVLGNGEGTSTEDYYNGAAVQFVATPTAVDLGDAQVTAIAAGQFYAVVLTEDGQLLGWGTNRGGQLGDYTPADNLGSGFTKTPVKVAVNAAEGEGIFTVNAQSIPSSLATAKKLILTGEWGTDEFAALSAAIGNNAGFFAAGNATIENIDMSQASIKENTELNSGANERGIFYGLKALTIVTMPVAEQAANFTNFSGAFWNCSELATIDLANCSGLTNLNSAFYGCKALKEVNIATANGITNTYSAFDGCEALETITLPATVTLSKFMFGSCTSLKTIDWSAYTGTEAPAMPGDFFQYVNNLEAITLKVPAAAYDSFAADANWSKLTLESVGEVVTPEEGVYTFDAQNIPADLSQARKIVLTGTWTTADFLALSNAIGNNASIPSPGNDYLEAIDMSQAVVEAGTSLLGSFPGMFGGSRESGIFYGCRALTTVTMPATEAGFKNISYAFQNCTALTSIDLSTCTSITNTANAFDGCTALASVVLPSTITLKKDMFAYCSSLTLIDWSAYEGTEAPTYVAIVDGFDPMPSNVTLIVPEAAYDSFAADTKWAKFNLVKATDSAITDIEVDKADAIKVVYDLNGRYVGSFENTNELPAGLYIINGKKVIK